MPRVLTSLERERAAYVWQLQCEHHTLDKQLADLRVIFQWLLQIHAGDTTTGLVGARAAYVAELYAEKPDLNAEIADLARLHHDLISAELDRSKAFSVPQHRGCHSGSERMIPQ
jgi:hypothetical protein